MLRARVLMDSFVLRASWSMEIGVCHLCLLLVVEDVAVCLCPL